MLQRMDSELQNVYNTYQGRAIKSCDILKMIWSYIKSGAYTSTDLMKNCKPKLILTLLLCGETTSMACLQSSLM